VPAEDLIGTTPLFFQALDQLSRRVEAIYVHIDLDVLDATAIPGHTFLIPNGPTGMELGKALGYILKNEKVKALGIASFPTVEKGREQSLKSTLETIKGGLEGWLIR
jgi:arginase family enzyme